MKFFQKAAWEVGRNTIMINYIYMCIQLFKKEVYIKFSGILVKSQTV